MSPPNDSENEKSANISNTGTVEWPDKFGYGKPEI